MSWIDDVRMALGDLRVAYGRVFAGVPGSSPDVVLKDLALFCRAHESTAHPDATVAARLDGRREVWLHIQEQLRLSPDQLWSLYIQRKGLTPTE